jgi:ribose-phosphate pyrophosphokinase
MSDSRPVEDGPAIFALESGQDLVRRICERLGVEPARHEEREFEDGEHKIRPLESVRGRDVYVVQSLFSDERLSVNDKLVRMLHLLATLGDAGAAKVTAVAPYLCYARKDMRTKSRDPVTTRYVAAHFEASGIDGMVVVDVHNRGAFENAFRVPTEHLTAASAFVDYFAEQVKEQSYVVVSPDAGGVKRAERFRQALQKRLEKPVSSAFIEKFRSEGVVRGGTLVGDVDDRVAIIIDDLISSGTTLVRAADACLDGGARAAYAATTHGVFSSGASDNLAASRLERLVITDTIPPAGLDAELLSEKVDVIDCAPILARAIAHLHGAGIRR